MKPRGLPNMAKVLVVDDTPHNVKLLADLLTVKGFGVATATNGEEALAKIAADPPDLVLLDIMMPGLSGYDVCQRLRADPQTALLPVVLVTSLDPQQERIKGIESGADDFLGKPINQPELFARVRSLLRIKTLQDEVRRQAAAAAGMECQARRACRAQVAELERMSALSDFSRPPCARPSYRRARSRSWHPSPRDLLRLRRLVRLHRVHRFGGAQEVKAVLREYPTTMGVLIASSRHARPFRRRRHPDLFQRPAADPGRCAAAAAMALEMQRAFAPLRARGQARLQPRSRHRHREGIRDARRVRLRGPVRLFGDRRRRQPGGAPMRRGGPPVKS